MRTLILASGSPRRRALLGELGLPFAVVVSNEREVVDSSLPPGMQAMALAERKAGAVAAGRADGLVLGADTIVVLDGDILGKPTDEADAARMLRRLAGRGHRVITGLALVDAATGEVDRAVVETTVHMRPLDAAEIAAYVAIGEPADKAGAYAIQGIGAALIDHHEGCFTNVVGLPLCAVARLLRDAEIAMPGSWSGCRLTDGTECPNLKSGRGGRP
jgi:septum formation protein